MNIKLVNVAIVSATAGFVLGYAVRRRDLEVQYADLNERDLENEREYWKEKVKELEAALIDTNRDALEYAANAEKKYTQALAEYKGEQELRVAASQIPDSVMAEEIAKGIMSTDQYYQISPKAAKPIDAAVDTTPPPKPSPALHARREPIVDKSKPYVVSSDEALNNEGAFGDVTLTYYAGDNTLVDEQEKPMTDAERLMAVGTNLPNGFGQLSGDENVVYIRNDHTKMYFEVVRNEGTYAEAAGLGE
jgi:hypothetical protein